MSNPITIPDSAKLINLGHSSGISWAALARQYDVPKGVLYDYAKRNKEPRKPEYRMRLGLPIVSLVNIVSGNIPDNCQVLGRYRVCQCGQRFVPNSPRRKRCYTCSPYREGRGK